MVIRTSRWGLLLVLSIATATSAQAPPPDIRSAFAPPRELRGDLSTYRSPLIFRDGHAATTAAEWTDRRREILKDWHDAMGTWPPPVDPPSIETLGDPARREGYDERRVRLKVAPDRTVEGYLLVPDGEGPFPAMLVVFYEPETAIGRGKPRLDFASRLARKGIACLSIGFDPRVIETDKSGMKLQPLSYLAYVASNARAAMATRPEIDAKRIGVMGHSYGGKWAMFAACLDDKFACGVWSDPGVAFDETRPNVNYWDPWYLGWEPGRTRRTGPISPDNPRTGAYRTLVENGHDLHELQALMAPRPFLVSGGSEDHAERWKALNHAVAANRLLGQSKGVAMTNRPDHTPTEESDSQIVAFLVHVLIPRGDVRAEEPLKAGVFAVDASPPVGSPLAYDPTKGVEQPLSCRGVVLIGDGEPVVLCAVDWIGIGNGGQAEFREALAKAAGTTPARVAVHTLHQHDAPVCDLTVDRLLARYGINRQVSDADYERDVIARAAAAALDRGRGYGREARFSHRIFPGRGRESGLESADSRA